MTWKIEKGGLPRNYCIGPSFIFLAGLLRVIENEYVCVFHRAALLTKKNLLYRASFATIKSFVNLDWLEAC